MAKPVKSFPFVQRKDPLSGIDEHLFSFFLKYYIPTERIPELQRADYFAAVLKVVEEYVEIDVKEAKLSEFAADILPSGSAAEGLSIPVFQHRITGNNIWNSDFDMLRVAKNFLAFDDLNDFPANNSPLTLSYLMHPTSRPGFMKLSLFNGKSEGEFLKSQDWEALKIVKDLAAVEKIEDTDIISHGPALTTTSKKLPIEIDNVYAIRCFSWPKTASTWSKRKHPSNWPSPALVADIFSENCYLVAVGHPLSAERHLEWRISFSLAEKKLAASLTLFQKKAYILLKILHREYFSSPKVIATYHLKTVLFWMCEKLPESFWSDSNMASCLFALLDKLTLFLSAHDLPNFFIPENNMLSHINSDFIKTILKKVIRIREDPLTALIDFDQKYRLVRGQRKPWKYSVDFFMKMSERVNSDDELFFICSQMLTDLANATVVQSGMTDWGIAEAYFFLKEAWSYHHPLCEIGFVQSISFARYLCLQVHNMFTFMADHPTQITLKNLLNIAEYIVTKSDRFLDTDTQSLGMLHSMIGTLCHCLAFWEPKFDQLAGLPQLSTEEKEEAKSKSEVYHNMAIGLLPEHNGIKIEYAKLLFHREAFSELIDLLGQVIDEVSEKEVTNITKVELPTLEANLQFISQKYINAKKIEVPQVVIALYYLVLANIKIEADKGVIGKYVKKLHLFCNNRENKTTTFTRQLMERLPYSD